MFTQLYVPAVIINIIFLCISFYIILILFKFLSGGDKLNTVGEILIYGDNINTKIRKSVKITISSLIIIFLQNIIHIINNVN